MISPFRFVSIKSLPHRAVGVSLFRCCCCYSRCCCCSSCVIIFVRFLILRSLLSVVVACLLLVVVVAGYVLMTIYASWPPLEIDRTLSWDCFDWFFLITGITHTSYVVVPRKLLSSSFFHPVVVSFVRCCRLALSALFADALKNYRFGGSWLICSWELSRLPWHFVCLLMSSCVAFFIPVDFDSVLFASSFVLFGRWLQHQGLTGPIGFLSDAG